MLTSKNEHNVIFGSLQTPLSVFAAFFDIRDAVWRYLMHAETPSSPALKNAVLVRN